MGRTSRKLGYVTEVLQLSKTNISEHDGGKRKWIKHARDHITKQSVLNYLYLWILSLSVWPDLFYPTMVL